MNYCAENELTRANEIPWLWWHNVLHCPNVVCMYVFLYAPFITLEREVLEEKMYASKYIRIKRLWEMVHSTF